MESDKTFDLMSKMYSEMNNKFDKMTSRMDNMYSEMQKMNNRLSNVESNVKDLKADTAKSSILLEKVDSNVKLLAEGQESFRSQLGRNNNDDKRSINDRLDVIELAVSNTSKTLGQNFNKLSEKIDDLQIDVNTTTSKAVKTENKMQG